MILRTPPPKKRRPIESSPAGSDGHLVIYEDPPESSHDPSDQMLCTYQCQQLVKSDLLDDYSTMKKSIEDYRSKLENVSENLLKAEAEAKNSKHLLNCAEQELSAARGREKALQEKVLMEVSVSQERLKNQIQRCNELEVELQKEQSSRKSAESLIASAEERANLLEKKLKHLSDNTDREKASLQDELVHIKKDSKLSVCRIKANLERVESRAVSAEKESELLKEHIEEFKERLHMSLCEKSELEKKLNSLTPLKEDVTSQSDILVKHLQEQLRNLECEVVEARKLKASCENIELLKEKLIEEKERRGRAEAEVLKLQEAQLMMEMLDEELSSWKNVIKEIPGVSSRDDISVKFAALQKEVIENMSKLGEANARLKQLEVALASAELDKKHAETDSALAREMADSLKLEVKQLESRLSSITEERNLLKTSIKDLKEQKNVQPGSEGDNRNWALELESSLALKESYCKELENKLIEQKATGDRCYNEIRMLNEKLNSEERRIKSLEREGDQLRSEIALLESKLGHGDFSTASTKVLRMVNALGVDNEARQTIEALQSELQKANEKLKLVEELKKQSADAGQLVDSYISGKIVQLKEQIATLEKREERYKTVFADRISVFRRACCELFGYKIVMDDRQRANGIPVTRFTLQSIYAQNDEEKLEFEYESGNTNIVVNEYTKLPEVSQQVEIFIRKLNSIPAFTANLTVETFNRRTLS